MVSGFMETLCGTNGDRRFGKFSIPIFSPRLPDWVIIPETVRQYTELKDKNGVEIFMGTSLECTNSCLMVVREKEIVGVIKQEIMVGPIPNKK